MYFFREFLEKYSRWIPAGALLFGFFFDLLTLGRPDSLYAHVILLSYLCISASAIFLLAFSRRRGRGESVFLLGLMQFSFGNLAGSLLILYGMSGTFAGSALFFGILLAFLFGNELIRERYGKVLFHTLAWFFLLLLYAVFTIPIILASIGLFVFSAAIVLALLVFTLFLHVLFLISGESFEGGRKRIFQGALVIALLFSVLYFGNFIPPVPLSLQQIGVYHSIVREERGYVASFETPRWYEVLRSTSRMFRVSEGEGAFCFSAVFATEKLQTPIWHVWEKYEEVSGRWEVISTLSFPISGGRDEGFRGYSQKSNMTEGKWRCSVETDSGVLIGRVVFDVVFGKGERLETFF